MEGGRYRWSDRHNDQPSHSISTELSGFFIVIVVVFWSPSLSSNQQLQAVLVAGLLRGAWGQEGGGHGGSCCCGDVEKGVCSDTGGCRVAERRRRCDAGEVDAEREPRLLQGFLWHGEGLEFLLTVGHVGVLATATDTIQARLRETTDKRLIHLFYLQHMTIG